MKQIPRTDLAGKNTWLHQIIDTLDEHPAGVFERRSDAGELRGEIECAWDEEPKHRRLAFPKRDSEGKPVLKSDGRAELVFGVKLARRRITFYEQAKKLVGIFPCKLASWRDEDGLQTIARMIQAMRGVPVSYHGTLTREQLAEAAAKRQAATLERLANMSQARREAEAKRMAEAEAKAKAEKAAKARNYRRSSAAYDMAGNAEVEQYLARLFG